MQTQHRRFFHSQRAHINQDRNKILDEGYSFRAFHGTKQGSILNEGASQIRVSNV